jgi:hypothetical protein
VGKVGDPTSHPKKLDNAHVASRLIGICQGRKGLKQCSIEDCNRKYWGRGYCQLHYARRRRWGDPLITHKKIRGICSVDGCDKPHMARGFCFSHYMKAKHQGFIDAGKCSIKDCNNGAYAKNLCRNHYEMNRRKGTSEYRYHLTNCKVPGCKKKDRFVLGYCTFHYLRDRAGIPLNAPNLSRKHMLGKKNPRWNGGISEYPNHSEMKRVRKQKIKDSSGKCVICGWQDKPPYSHLRIHHIDRSKDNHFYDNLLVACPKCSMKFHKSQPHKTSKILRLYGISLKQLADNFGGSSSKYYIMHRTGILKDFIEKKTVNTIIPSLPRLRQTFPLGIAPEAGAGSL